MPLRIPPPPIASYDFDEVSDSTATVTYHLYNAEDTDSKTYKMSTVKLHSGETAIVEKDVSNATTLYTFETTKFNAPRQIKGDVRFAYTSAISSPSTANLTDFTVKLFHYDGTTATQIGSTWTAKRHTGTSSDTSVRVMNGNITLSSAEKFKRGDLLRFELAIIGIGTENVGRSREVGTDPENKDSNLITPSTNALETTEFKVLVPFKINL